MRPQDGELDFEEFSAILKRHRLEQFFPRKEQRDVFKAIDKDLSNKVRRLVDELWTLMRWRLRINPHHLLHRIQLGSQALFCLMFASVSLLVRCVATFPLDLSTCT